MSYISTLILVQLNGEPPPELNLPLLRTLAASCTSILQTLSGYLRENATVVEVTSVEDFASVTPTTSMIVIYVVGHAWMKPQFRTAIRTRQGSRILSGVELAQHLLAAASRSTEVLLFVDTCNAASLIGEIKTLRMGTTTCVIAASSEGENTLEYPLDRTTRFAATVKSSIEKAPEVIPAEDLAVDIRRRLSRVGIMPAQFPIYWACGNPVALQRRTSSKAKSSRYWSRTYLVLRILLIATGVGIALLVPSVQSSYRNHHFLLRTYKRLSVELPDLSPIANSASMEVLRLSPEVNGMATIYQRNVLRVRNVTLNIPASDLLVVLRADYKDQRAREVRFHLNLTPEQAFFTPRVTLAFPSANSIQNHPDMAYVPAGIWQGGPNREKRESLQTFWIDIYPVSARQYIGAGLDTEKLSQRNVSFQKSKGTLGGSLSLGNTCEECPAIFTEQEAQSYCKEQGKRLPTVSEWELAARGVDGRLYPWGEQFDEQRTNCRGLPAQGQPAATLQPSSKYLAGASPFGVIDMVGNAGDWVDSKESYSSFMGGYYAFNPEDCTVFAELPATSIQEIPSRETTARCVDPSNGNNAAAAPLR